MIYIGFDPGKNGGLVATDAHGHVEAIALRFALIGSGAQQRIDGRVVHDWLDRADGGAARSTLVVERVHAMPTDSPRSAFAFGRALGSVHAICESRGMRILDVRPVDWQKVMLHGKPRQKRAQRKESARQVASDLFPGLAEMLRIKANDGVADAALLAEYGRRMMRDE